jgi:hypothetical protein
MLHLSTDDYIEGMAHTREDSKGDTSCLLINSSAQSRSQSGGRKSEKPLQTATTASYGPDRTERLYMSLLRDYATL